jgi:hypothetical protein
MITHTDMYLRADPTQPSAISCMIGTVIFIALRPISPLRQFLMIYIHTRAGERGRGNEHTFLSDMCDAE